jgi:succinoglycan biosynthesis protein ExoO
MSTAVATRLPELSLLMVVRNGAAHIDQALMSARRQTFPDIEILVVDDGSTDATCSIVRRHAAEDARVRLESGPRQGLAAIRNRSLELARAPWAAILDSDDILHPNHARRLIDLIRRTEAPIVAMNMIAFGAETAELFASGDAWSRERAIDLETFVAAGRLDQSDISLGYLKPAFRIAALNTHDLRYDTRLRIGEDYDLVERALAKGLTYAFSPEPTYFYRRHEGSTSFRLSCDDLRALIAAEDERPQAPPGSTMFRVRVQRQRSLKAALAHTEAVAEFKAGRIRAGMTRLLRTPAAVRMMAMSVREGMLRRLRKQAEGSMQDQWSALICGTPQPGSRMEQAAQLLTAQGCELRWIEDATSVDPATIAQAGRGVSLVLVADDTRWEATAFAIPDGAPVFGFGAATHPLIDAGLPVNLADLLRLAGRTGDTMLQASLSKKLAA